MTDEWKTRILELRYRTTEAEALEFVDLVYMAEGSCDIDTCRILVRTFVTDDDYGVQESVNGVLSTARPQDRQLALLEELPRIMVEAPEHGECLVEGEIRFYLDSFRETVRSVQPHLRETLTQVLERGNFNWQFPNLSL